MQAEASVVAEHFGISIEKLERLSKRRDCLKGIVTEDGEYDTVIVGKMLDRLKRIANAVKQRHAEKAGGTTGKKTIRRKKQKPVGAIAEPAETEQAAETLEEFIKRFWEEEERWWEFITCDANEDWMKHFIQKALEFGYTAAYPGAEQEG